MIRDSSAGSNDRGLPVTEREDEMNCQLRNSMLDTYRAIKVAYLSLTNPTSRMNHGDEMLDMYLHNNHGDASQYINKYLHKQRNLYVQNQGFVNFNFINFINNAAARVKF